MSRPVTIGLVGTGDVGQTHAQACADSAEVQLAIAAGRDRSRADELAQRFGARLFDSYEAMLADREIAAVDLCIPNHLHADYTVRAARAGKHVLCEKPMALSLCEADAMIRACEKAGVALMIAHPLRFWPEYEKARELILGGALGRPQSVSARRLTPLLLAVRGAGDWRHNAEQSGGAVVDLQIHDIDYFVWLFGAPELVYAQGVRSEDGAWSHVMTTLTYADGTIASAEASMMLKGNPVVMDLRVIGTEASLEYQYVVEEVPMHNIHGGAGVRHSAPCLTLYRWGQKPQVISRQEGDPIRVMFQEEIAYFARCVAENVPPERVPVSHSREALRICLAAADSCEKGQPVRL
jgi:UDP-N-acetylglucosamine 3-dehydrogenase